MSPNVKKAGMAYCTFVDTVFEGSVPIERGTDGHPVTYPTLDAARRDIAEDTIDRLEQFLAGERDYEDAMTVEEYIVQVTVADDGAVVLAEGTRCE